MMTKYVRSPVAVVEFAAGVLVRLSSYNRNKALFHIYLCFPMYSEPISSFTFYLQVRRFFLVKKIIFFLLNSTFFFFFFGVARTVKS